MSAAAFNPYLPRTVTIDGITVENDAGDLKTFKLSFVDKADAEAFRHQCGQFAMISVPCAGESPIGIASSPLDAGHVAFTVKRYPTGVVTTALHDMEEGAQIGLRGPYGNAFPMEQLKGKNILVISGGFAFTTLRATIRYMLDPKMRSSYGKITLIYGARSPGELLYKAELAEWQARKDVDVHITVDKGDDNWKGRVGVVPAVLTQVAPSAENAVALVCGPPVMLHFTMPPLLQLGFTPENIFTSLERKMSCGVGKCGRCGVGSKYVCKDGPIFTYAQLQAMPENVC
jgi:sulfhydrogenase subunit gamma (sulfur reductase)